MIEEDEELFSAPLLPPPLPLRCRCPGRGRVVALGKWCGMTASEEDGLCTMCRAMCGGRVLTLEEVARRDSRQDAEEAFYLRQRVDSAKTRFERLSEELVTYSATTKRQDDPF